MLRLVIIFSTLISLTACSHKTAMSWQQHQYFDFAKVHHYQLSNNQAKFAALANLPASEQALVELTLEQVLSKHGILLAEQTPDVWISYYLIQQSEQEKKLSKHKKTAKTPTHTTFNLGTKPHDQWPQYNQLVHFCWLCLSPSEQQKLQQNNTLVIDFIDPKTQNSVWRSSWQLNWKDDDNSQQRQQKLQQALSAMLSTYPAK